MANSQKHTIRLWKSLLSLALISASIVHADEPFTSPSTMAEFELVRSYYAFDPKLPLEASIVSAETHDKVVHKSVRFRGPDREWVTARLAIPKGVAKPPVAILLHGITQSKDQWWRQSGAYSFPSAHREVLVENGFAVLALDARNHGDRIEAKDFENAGAYLEFGYFEGAKKMVAETAIDVFRAIDFLEGLKEVDAEHLGIVGFSLGAHVGWIASALDQRIDKTLLMAMPMLGLAEGHTQSFTDPTHYLAGMSGKHVMLVAAKQDSFYTVEQISNLYDRIDSDHKTLNWVDGGHDLPRSTADFTRDYFARAKSRP